MGAQRCEASLRVTINFQKRKRTIIIKKSNGDLPSAVDFEMEILEILVSLFMETKSTQKQQLVIFKKNQFP